MSPHRQEAKRHPDIMEAVSIEKAAPRCTYSFLLVSRGLVVNLEFIRQLGPRSCILKDGREILLSRGNMEQIHAAYAAYVFSQLSKRDRMPLESRNQ